MIISILVFLLAVAAHETAHGYAAYLMGDRTAKDAGRLTLNPIAHIDPVGTVVLPALLILARSPVLFGWAKPVPVDPRNFRYPRKGMFITSLAGPFTNFGLAIVAAVILKTGIVHPPSAVWTFLLYSVIINLILGVFNLLPVPPLDGANMLFSVLPVEAYRYFMRFERYGFLILMGLLYLGLFDRVILPAVYSITRFLMG
jgi:Zn-dependent protease